MTSLKNDCEVMVFFCTLIMPFVCDCIQIKGHVGDLITVCKCKYPFKSVMLSVMFVIIFSGSSALPLQLFVVGAAFVCTGSTKISAHKFLKTLVKYIICNTCT